MSDLRGQFRFPRSIWAVLAFFVGFTVLIAIVSHYFLIPALEAAQDATPLQKRHLTAYSRLVLAIVLMILFVGMLFTFRVRRFFQPRGQAQKTEYIDAWSEAGKRAQAPPAAPDEDI